MKRLAVSTRHVPPCLGVVAVHRARVVSGLARCRHPSRRAHQGRACESSPAHEGIRRVGAPSMRRPSRAAKDTLVLTHPSNLRETGTVTRARPVAAAASVAVTTGRGERWASNVVPSRSSAERMPATRRARATTAMCVPRRAAMWRAHAWRASASGGRRRCTVGRGLEHDPRPGPLAEHGREARGLGADPLLDQLAPFHQDKATRLFGVRS
jgi:hypothetical protein